MERTTSDIKRQQGFAHVLLALLIVLVLGAIGFATWFVFKKNNQSTDSSSNSEQTTQKASVKIKSIGINLAPFDPTTGMAGDLKFTKFQFPDGGFSSIFEEFGRLMPGNSARGYEESYNPQPTFVAPLGTKVHALIDGTVVDVPKLYSGDYSVHVQGEGSDYIFETEHVINVTVKKGDTVKAGDVVGEVSDYDSNNLDGMGLFEIGVLVPGPSPSHACPFNLLDDSIKTDTLDLILSLEKSWEEYRGDNTIYDEASQAVPGCDTLDLIKG